MDVSVSLVCPNDSKIVVGDALFELKRLPDNYVQTCITSPPYWGLRDYGVDDQIGAEQNLPDYIDNLIRIFSEVRRVLRPDGTLWLNIGDGYTSGNRTWRGQDRKNPARAMQYRPPTPKGLKPKDLIGIPWRVAFALQEEGWYLRSDIIWHKLNAQPESVKDRPTQAHEYLFLLSKSEKYFYDHKSVREPTEDLHSFRNCRSLWSIRTQPNGIPHFAVFPTDLVKRCLMAGSKPKDLVLDPFLGSGTVGVVCRDMDRRFVGIEIKPEYAKLAQSRILPQLDIDGELESRSPNLPNVKA